MDNAKFETANFSVPTNVSTAKKLASVMGIMALPIAVELGTLYFAVTSISPVRAFVGAERLGSKSQKCHLQFAKILPKP